jgi:tellurite methyltransferase
MTDDINGVLLQPSQFLVKNIGLLPRGWALDVAMGAGRNAIYLARMGFDVEGVDVSISSVDEALARAREASVSIRTRVVNLEKFPDFGKENYDLVICFNYLQRALLPKMKDWLKPGGVLMYETFIIDQSQFGRPKNPDFLLQHNELLHAFGDFRVLRYREGIIENRKAVASLLAQKPGLPGY